MHNCHVTMILERVINGSNVRGRPRKKFLNEAAVQVVFVDTENLNGVINMIIRWLYSMATQQFPD